MDWEMVIEHRAGTGEDSIYRLKIPEGWLYRYGNALAFVPGSAAKAKESDKPSIFAPPATPFNLNR